MGQSKAEKDWKSDAASLGCVVCRNRGFGETPAAIHHLRDGQGKGQRASDLESIPLCPTHHQYSRDGETAFHDNKTLFEQRYGTERELLAQTQREVEALRKNIIGRR